MASSDLERMQVMPLQTRVNKEDHDRIRGAMDADRKGPTAWIRDVLIAVAAMDPDARQALLEATE